MSDTKFTPGPWVKDYGGTLGHIKSVASGQGFRGTDTPTVARYDIVAISLEEEQLEANANLIASAPDMYEALTLAVEKLKQYAEADEEANGYGDGCFQRPDEFIDAAVGKCETVLAKARGEE